MQITKYTNVYNEFGDPLKGAHISIGNLIGTTTSSNGFGELTASGDAVVRVSYVGTEPQYFKLIELPKKITLKMESLDEVTVTSKKKQETPKYLIPAIGATLLLIALMSFGEETKEITL
ncbi:hypothetical protein ACNKXS_03395 [Christiangramia marina]|uniref:hypothetical protein n=1 Tax=Christiangramia marina TaxID=409436 RepID=UPI003AA834EB